MNRRQFLNKSAGLGAFAAISGRGGWRLAAQQDSQPGPTSTPAKGPLRILKANPRYFTDGSGKAIYLAGSHIWWNFEDSGLRFINARDQDPPPVFDFNAYLDFLQAHNHNFFRLWRWEAPKWGEDQPRGLSSIPSLNPGYAADQAWREMVSPSST